MFNFKLRLCVVIFLFILREIEPKISDKRLCANENCTKPISRAKTILRYPSDTHGILSFDPNVEVTVYSKSAGSNMELWGVEINGARGYAPKSYIRETKVLIKDLKFLVDTSVTDQQVPSSESDTEPTIKANKVPDFTVIDGTTVYLEADDSISPTPTVDNISPTSTVGNPVEANDDETDDHKATQPLQLELNQPIADNHEVNDDETAGDDKKESLTQNLIQSVIGWIGDDKSDDKEAEVEEEDLDDEEDDEEEGDDEDGYDSEEEDADEYEDSNEKDNGDINAKGGDVPIEQDKPKLNDGKIETDETIENGIKLRQLLSEKGSLNNQLIEEPVITEQNKIKEIKEEALNDSDIDSIPITTPDDIEPSIEAITESAFSADNGGLEIPAPHYDHDITTANPINEIDGKTDLNPNPDENPIIDSLGEANSESVIITNQIVNVNESVKSDGEKIEITLDESSESLSNDPIESDSHIGKNIADDSGNIIENELVKSEAEVLDEKIEITLDESSESLSNDPIESDSHIGKNIADDSDIIIENELVKSEGEVSDEKIEITLDESSESISNDPIESDNHMSKNIGDDSGNTIENQTERNEVSKEEEIIPEPTVEVPQVLGSQPEEYPKLDDPIPSSNEQLEQVGTVNITGPDQSEDVTSDQSIEVETTNTQILDDSTLEPLKEVETPVIEIREDSHKDILPISEQLKEIEMPSSKISEDIQDRTSEQSEVSTAEELEDLSIENISGVLGGITNWFGGGQNKEEIITSGINEDSEIVNEVVVETVESHTPQVEKESIDYIHNHDFLSMIDQTQNNAQSDEVQSEMVNNEANLEEIEDLSTTGGSIEEEERDVGVNEEISKDEGGDGDGLELVKENDHIFDVRDELLSKNSVDYASCPAGENDCPSDISTLQKQLEMEDITDVPFYSDFLNLLTLLGVTGFSVAIFLLGFITIDKNRKEGSLIAKINTLEKALLVASKENALLADRLIEIQNETSAENDRISSQEYENLNKTYEETLTAKSVLEDQIQSLEKELENSTEVGLELNRMLSDILSSQNGSEILIANVEQLQRQLIEQQGTINTINDTLNLKDTENHELQLELDIKNKKVTHLQAELDKMAMNLFKAEEDKELTQAKLEGEIIGLKDEFERGKNSFNSAKNKFHDEINNLKTRFSEVQRNLDVKTNEYDILKDNFNQIKMIKNNTEALESLINASSMKAELQQLQRDNQLLSDLLKQEQQTKFTLEKQIEIALQEAQNYRAKYDEADKGKLEARTKLDVLSNYFKEKEAHLQKELSKQESMWMEKQGEATSTVERIKYMQEELQNCKSQNELLKQEIVQQEVELKSQISVLEKKAHESWVAARQAERRLEDARQESAQLRNRLTLKERSLIEEKNQNRMQSPLEQNGDVAISPLHIPVDTPASPPLLYGTRDHMTTSPPLPSLPPFLPPPPGVPFMPPPIPGVPGFMPPPPPPSMFSVDHRPPPLGRMSSPPPPLNSRYSPDSRYSPYDRNSPSPPYDDEYGSSPPPIPRGYSPYRNRDDRRDFKRPPPPHRANGRNKGAMSSGSGNSNESLEKINRHHSSKV